MEEDLSTSNQDDPASKDKNLFVMFTVKKFCRDGNQTEKEI